MNDMFLDDTDLGGMIESVDAVSSEPEITVDKPEEISNNEPSEPPEHQEDNANIDETEQSVEQNSEVAKTTDAPPQVEERYIEVKTPNGVVKYTEKEIAHELQQNLFRQDDYTRKGQQRAEEYRQLQSDFINKSTALIEKFNPLTQLEAHRNNLINQAKEAYEIGDNETLIARRLDLMELEKTINATQQEIDTLYKAKQWQDEQITAQQLSVEREKLFNAIPELKNPEKAKEFQTLTYNALSKVGYSADDMAQMTKKVDAKQALLAYAAGKYFEMQNKAPEVAKNIQDKIVSVKPSATKTNNKQSEIQSLQRDAANGDDYAIGRLMELQQQ
jgi:hypothetical protein